jgi:long-chain acyl-CoA synthetase
MAGGKARSAAASRDGQPRFAVSAAIEARMESTIRIADEVRTKSEVAARAARAANGFKALGVVPGDTVAIVLRNDFAFLEATVAAGLAGAYVVPVNWHNTADEARYVLEDSAAKIVVIHADLLARLGAATLAGVHVLVAETPDFLAAPYNVDPDAARVPDGAQSWQTWLAGFDTKFDGTVGAPGSMIYTSGTTGRPKGVRRRLPTPEQIAGLQEMRLAICGFGPWRDTPHEITALLSGPLYHSTPNAWLLAFYELGANMVIAPRFDAEEMLANVERRRITHLLAVPTMFVRLLKLGQGVRGAYDVSSLKFVMHGAAPCPVHVKHAMIEWWGPVIHEHYGGTETGAVTYLDSHEWLAHPGSVGRALDNARVMVLSEDGRELSTDAVGEIVCRHMYYADFTYHGDDAKRRRAEKQGLIALGDLGYLDRDGYLYLCGRATDMIISGGVNIYPAEIEAEILKHPGVADCAVFGIPDEEFGEQVCAFVQRRPGQSVSAEALRTALKSHIAGYKLPKRIEFHDTLPREDSGKIFKRKLREPFWP